MSELLDLKLQDEFSFRMSSLAERGQKEELQTDCGRVVDLAKATVKDMCLLAVQLYEMRDKEHWQHVINPKTGFGFYNDTFADFCEYAFGFSKTKTSDLLRISQFVSLHGDNRGEIEAGYQSYNTSQLIELASVPPSNRGYFNSDMSVAEMRVAKDYVKNSAEFIEEKKKVGFDLLTKAQEWKSSAKKSEPIKPDIMDGQMSLFSEENEETDDDGAGLRNPTSDLAEPGEEIEQEYSYDVDEYDEADGAQEDMHAEMETIEADAEESVSQTPRVDFSSRAKIREFLSGFQKWGRRFCAYPLEFMSVYYHSFRNNKAILAVLSPGCNDMEKMASDHSTVRYYWKNELNGKYFEVTTRELERVIPLIKDEL